MDGQLTTVIGVQLDMIKQQVAVETSSPLTEDQIADISFISTRPIPRTVDGRPSTPHEAWSVLGVQEFRIRGGRLIRSEQGNLSLVMPFGPFGMPQLGDLVVYSTD
ncbi:MAG: hypothetical protein AB7O68_14605 [Pirellulales bacterium]